MGATYLECQKLKFSYIKQDIPVRTTSGTRGYKPMISKFTVMLFKHGFTLYDPGQGHAQCPLGTVHSQGFRDP